MCIWGWLGKQLFIRSTLIQMPSPPGHTDYTIVKKLALWFGKGLFLGTPPNFADSFLFSFVTRIGEIWVSTPLTLCLSLVFLQRSSGKQMIQMHVNNRQGAFNELCKLSSHLVHHPQNRHRGSIDLLVMQGSGSSRWLPLNLG